MTADEYVKRADKIVGDFKDGSVAAMRKLQSDMEAFAADLDATDLPDAFKETVVKQIGTALENFDPEKML